MFYGAEKPFVTIEIPKLIPMLMLNTNVFYTPELLFHLNNLPQGGYIRFYIVLREYLDINSTTKNTITQIIVTEVPE